MMSCKIFENVFIHKLQLLKMNTFTEVLMDVPNESIQEFMLSYPLEELKYLNIFLEFVFIVR